MNWEEFYTALEMLVWKVYNCSYNYDNLKEYVNEIEKALSSS